MNNFPKLLYNQLLLFLIMIILQTVYNKGKYGL